LQAFYATARSSVRAPLATFIKSVSGNGRCKNFRSCRCARRCVALATTKTFKQKKQQLAREGFDSSVVKDPLFFQNPKSGEYQPIYLTVYRSMLEGSIRL